MKTWLKSVSAVTAGILLAIVIHAAYQWLNIEWRIDRWRERRAGGGGGGDGGIP